MYLWLKVLVALIFYIWVGIIVFALNKGFYDSYPKDRARVKMLYFGGKNQSEPQLKVPVFEEVSPEIGGRHAI